VTDSIPSAGRPDRYLIVRRRASILLALACGWYFLGQGVTAYAAHILHHASAFPSVGDACSLAASLFYLAGAVLLLAPVAQPGARLRLLLDAVMITIAAGAFVWCGNLGPLIVASHAGLLARGVLGGYAGIDLAIVFSLALLAPRARDRQPGRIMAALTAAGILMMLADSVYAFQFVHGLKSGSGAVSVVRGLGCVLLAGAAWMGYAGVGTGGDHGDRAESAVPRPGRTGERPHVWRCLLPYMLMPPIMALMIYVALSHTDVRVALGVYLFAAVLVELGMIHQFLIYRRLLSSSNRTLRLESLVGADATTGLPNHRSLIAAIDQEIARSHRTNRSCAVLFLDLDHFKALNDTFGHPAGDAALREFSALVRPLLRASDTLGRWGGEEFMALLPETDGEQAASLAERIRTTVACHAFWATGGGHVTCSLGVASYPADASDRDGLIARADHAMYAAKQLGRNQVRCANEAEAARHGERVGIAGSREEAALVGTVEALAGLVEARDYATAQHVQTVAELAARLATALGVDEPQAEMVGLAGRLHDIGKVAVPDAILQKPSALTPDEWALMREHPVIGAATVSKVPVLRSIVPVIRSHHERWDGRGYPDGLAGVSIPLGARILAVADAYSAMTSDRPYRPARTIETALAEVQRCSGSQFDPEVVAALARIVGQDAPEMGNAGAA
jgi:diguanylate cyclase (GGDEF)-like protein/putative nucleotidyltransferase with HDIG domain